MVTMERIGQSAYLLPNGDMLAYGRVSETERIWVHDEGVSNLSELKIQSIPLGKLSGSESLLQLSVASHKYSFNIIIKNYYVIKLIQI